uniref:AWPM-19-like family protein n=1 Tax=Leersia perrieri TaxID=77586 RepID=A0A0D9WGA0_9ORYZ
MATGGPSSLSSGLLFLNLVLYVVVAVIAGWAINYSIDESYNSLQGVSPPVRLFPIYFPIGNLATGFFVIFALLAGVVGVSTSLTGLHDVSQGLPASMMSAAAASIVTWTLTLLAMGLACKEISLGWRPASLRALEAFTIILAGTQLLCAGSLHAGAHAAIIHTPMVSRV